MNADEHRGLERRSAISSVNGLPSHPALPQHGSERRLSLDVERPAVGGAMIARSNGQVVLVTGAVPGERVQARIDRVDEASLRDHRRGGGSASPDRAIAVWRSGVWRLPHSHIAYERQLAIKSPVIADAFARIGRLEVPAAIPVAASREDGYRMRARLHVRGAA